MHIVYWLPFDRFISTILNLLTVPPLLEICLLILVYMPLTDDTIKALINHCEV